MINPSKYYYFLIIHALLAIGALGCVTSVPTTPEEPPDTDTFEFPRKVAILPFSNHTSSPDAAPLVRKMFYNFFSSLNYLDVEPTIVDDNLKSHSLFQQIVNNDPVSYRQIGDLLGVDAIITGEISSFGKRYALLYSETIAGLNVKMIDCNSEKTLWDMEHIANIRD